MRQRLGVFIPFLLLAILVQSFAPIAALRMLRHAVGDPLQAAPICSHEVGPADDAHKAPGDTSSRADCCAFCGSSGGVVVNQPAVRLISLQGRFQLVSWLEAVDQMPAVRVGSNTQARAPPQAA